MSLTFQRCISAAILMVWGVLFLFFWGSGKLGAYLHPSFHVWTLIAGMIFVGLALGMIFLPGEAHEHHHHHHHAHEEEADHETHAHHSHEGHEPHGHEEHGDCDHCHHESEKPWRLIFVALVLIAPLVIAMEFSPGQFGASTVRNRGVVEDIKQLPGFDATKKAAALAPVKAAPQVVTASTPPASPSDGIPRTESGAIKADAVDLLYAAQDPVMRADLENQPIELVGQYMPSKVHNISGKRFSLVKMYVVCCAADARPVAVEVEAHPGEKFSEMSWVKVSGKAEFPVEGGRRTALVVADKVQSCDPPDDSLIYNK